MSVVVPNRRQALPVSCTAHIVQDGLMSTIYVLLPVLAQTFGLTYAQVGLLKGLNNASQAILEFASGWLAERLGEVRLIAVGLSLTGAGYLLLSQAQGVAVVTACLLLIGAGTALHHAPSSALIANSYSARERSGPLGIYNASGDVGKLVFTGGFSLAAGIGLAWQQVGLIYGLLAVGASISVLLATGSHTRQRRAAAEEAAGQAELEPAPKGWGILDWRSFGALLAVTSIDTVVQTGVLVFMSFLMLAKGLPLAVATGATVVLLAGGAFGKAACGYLANRLGARRAFTLIQVLTAIGLVAIVVSPNWLSLLLLAPVGAVAQGSTSISYGFAANCIHPRRMARGYALLYSTGTLAAVAGPLAFGWVADITSVDNAIYLMALMTLTSIPPMALLRTLENQAAASEAAS